MLLVFFIASLVLSLAITKLVRRGAYRFNLVDRPDSDRKQHPKPTALAGGLACYSAFTLMTIAVLLLAPSHEIAFKKILGLLLGGAVLILGGILDDRFNLKPWQQFLFPLLAVIIIISSGIGLDTITHPWYNRASPDGRISLNWAQWEVVRFQGLPYFLSWPADVLTLFWVLGMIYTTKFLDGLDGLVSGVSAIGAVYILAVSLALHQRTSPFLALIFLGVMLGFMWYNRAPASIFLGEGGSTWAGFMLATLAIMSEAKLTVTAMAMGLPILDVIWVISYRIFVQKKSPFKGDRAHLHFRLLQVGLSSRQVVFLLYIMAAALGAAGLLFKNVPIIWLLSLIFIMTALISFLLWLARRTHSSVGPL